MKTSVSLLLAAVFTVVLSGCMAMHERRAVREDVSPNPMSLSAWAQVVGTYVGPIRSANRRFGNDGVNTMDVRLEISGSPEYPLIFLQTRTAFSGALILSGERAETFTNIPERHYGVRASVAATSHDPDQLRLMLKSQPLSPTLGGFMTLTFRGRGCAEVDFIEHAGRRGDGILKRLPRLPGVCRE